ncbi:SIS domain-containing protein [Curtobacterium sp. MCBD17_040]|uniref:SIS domain-containing protein n=1 Tax=Curtobacterium sp. MCBD17_040 TaxID=2175674 RepID=UPI000DAA0692|nr:SIS domain-containing protein [Curtobacterium sp. MCBD17_040]WIB64673.1 SIS domain-containing protein [Curtobacterium sp. MCBD17_040]
MTETNPDIDVDLAAAGATATFREIRQQPDVWLEAASIVQGRRADLDAFLAPLLAHDDLRIVFTGAGTSAFAGGVVAPTVARATGRRVESIATTDIVSNPRHYLAEDVPTLLVSFARSGNSPESVAATRLTDQVLGDASHLVITCNAGGALAQEHQERPDSFVLLMPQRSDDAGFAMTSSFTSMMLSALLAFLGDAPETVAALSSAANQVIGEDWDSIKGLAQDGLRRLVYLGSGPLAALAQESALKTLELTAGGVVSYHDSSLGFRHGPKAVLDAETLVVVYISNDPYTRSYDLDIVAELRTAIGASRVLSVATDGVGEGAIVLEGLRGTDDGYLAIAYILVAQILALSFALRVGTTPDNPFPGGDVNRVVQGVHIHELEDSAGDGR